MEMDGPRQKSFALLFFPVLVMSAVAVEEKDHFEDGRME